MQAVTASEAKNHFGQFLEAAFAGAVSVLKSGREVAVLVSAAEYRRLRQVEENYNLLQALADEKDGVLSVERSEAMLDAMVAGTYRGPSTKA